MVRGEAHVDESLVAGESRPVKKSPGDEVISGSLLLSGSLTIKVSRPGSDTYIAQVMRLVREAMVNKTRTRTSPIGWRSGSHLIALGGGAVTAAAWLWLGYPLVFAVERTVTVMVITCPHALGMVIPLVVAKSTAIATEAGVLVRRRQAFEAVKDVATVVFDKTGTLTGGVFEVTEIISLGGLGKDEVLQLAASLEAMSEHPIAKAIVEFARRRGISPKLEDVEGFEGMPGKGVRGLVGGREVMVVGENYLREAGIEAPPAAADLGRRGATVVYVIAGDSLAALVGLSDVIRPEAVEVV